MSDATHTVDMMNALFNMMRPELFSGGLTWLALPAVFAAASGMVLLITRRLRRIQSALFLVSLAAVVLSTFLVKLGGDKLSVVYGCFTAYLLTSVWLERQCWSEHAGATERFLFSVPLAVAFAAGIQWLQIQVSVEMTFGQSIYVLILSVLALMAVIGDAQRVMIGERSMTLSRDRLCWRVCFAVHVLVASTASVMEANLTLSAGMKLAIFLPECALLAATLYYLLRTYAHPITDWVATRPIGSNSLRA